MRLAFSMCRSACREWGRQITSMVLEHKISTVKITTTRMQITTCLPACTLMIIWLCISALTYQIQPPFPPPQPHPKTSHATTLAPPFLVLNGHFRLLQPHPCDKDYQRVWLVILFDVDLIFLVLRSCPLFCAC